MSRSSAVTFMFTDIEASTRRWEHEPTAMAADLAVHDRLITDAVTSHGGTVFKHTGDGLCAVFPESGAVRAAIAAQRALGAQRWQVTDGISARIGLHRGEAIEVGSDFFGPTLNRAARIMSAGHGGQTLASRSAVDAEDELPEGWDVVDLGSHELRDLVANEHLLQINVPDLADSFPPLRVLSAYRHNLPAQLTALVGRDEDVETVTEMLAEHRLVTLAGIGGCGKSRLAVHVAAESLPKYAGGVWLVPLANLADPRFVAMAIANTVGYNERLAGIDDSDQPAILQQVASGIGDAHMLLVLDNCEHLVQSVAEAAAILLSSCPNLAIVATSREVLKVPGERVLAVPPLQFPGESAGAAEVLATASGQLFAERAAATQPGFAVTEENASAVASICRRLDGLPLALELAAARVRMLDPAQIDARLGESLALLAHGDRTASDRHRTLLATLEWSHELLDDSERTVLRRLSVFRGGATLEAAEAVCGAPPLDNFEVLEAISGLVDRSLVTTTHGDPARYGLLEVVRQFADEKLMQADESAEIRRRHFEWALSLAETIGPVERHAGTAELRPERHNLRAAFACDSSVGVTGEDRLRFAYALWRYMVETSQIVEGQSMLEQALADEHPPGTAVEARALDAAAFFAALRGEQGLALERVDVAIERCRDLGEPLHLAWALYRKATILGLAGDCAPSLVPAVDARDLFDAAGFSSGQAWVNLGIARSLVSLDEVAAAREALARARAADAREELSCLAAITIAEHSCDVLDGDVARAPALITDVERLLSYGMQHTTSQALLIAVPALIVGGHDDPARQLLARLLAVTHISGGVTEAVVGLTWSAALLSTEVATRDDAFRIASFAADRRSRIGVQLTPLFERAAAGRADAIGVPVQIVTHGDLAHDPSRTLDDAIRSARRLLDQAAPAPTG